LRPSPKSDLGHFTLHAVHVPEDTVADQCRRHGFRAWSRTPTNRRASKADQVADVDDVEVAAPNWQDSIVLFAADSAGALMTALALPARCCVEDSALIHDYGGIQRLLHCDWSRSPDSSFDLIVTAGTAFDQQLAALVCQALVARGAIAGKERDSVALAIHEAIANAVVHGSFELDGFPRDSMEAFADYSEALTACRGNPDFANRVIQISADWTGDDLVVRVSDDGPGFDAEALSAAAAASGLNRGMALIDAMSKQRIIDQDGRRISLWFDRG